MTELDTTDSLIHAVCRNTETTTLPRRDGSRPCRATLPPHDEELPFRFERHHSQYCDQCVRSALSYFADPWFELPPTERGSAFLWRDERGAAAFDPMMVSFQVMEAFEEANLQLRAQARAADERERIADQNRQSARELETFHVIDFNLERRSLSHPLGLRTCEATLPTSAVGTWYAAEERAGELDQYPEDRYCPLCCQTLAAWGADVSSTVGFISKMYWVSPRGLLTDLEPAAQSGARSAIMDRFDAKLAEIQSRLDDISRSTDDLVRRMHAEQEETLDAAPLRHNAKWSAEDEYRLVDLYTEGQHVEAICADLERTRGAVTSRIAKILMVAAPEKAFDDSGFPAFPDLDVPEELWTSRPNT